MKLANSISVGLAKMESKLTGLSNHHQSSAELETGSINHELIGSSQKYEPTAMLVARMIARTMLLMTVIICSLILLSIYIQSKSTNHCEFVSETSQPGPYFEPMTATAETDVDDDSSRRHIPISIRMSGRAGDLMNLGHTDKKGQVNCLIERKTANQIIASEPKKLVTPFGNITTDPRLIHLTGEKLVFSCHSGDKNQEKEEQENKNNEKHIKQLIIISSGKDSIDPNSRGQQDETTDGMTPSTPMTNPEPDNTSTMARDDQMAINNVRSKRQALWADSINHQKKECLCKCA